MQSLAKKIIGKIKPSETEIIREMDFAEKLIAKIRSIEGKHIDVLLAGSLARNTHLKGDRDIDIFVLFSEELNKEEFVKEGLRIGKAVFRGHKWEKAYSQHPYIRGVISGFDVEIVPSYKVERTELLKSAVDRTPFHQKYLEEKLKKNQKDEVRLLRQFLKGIGCYGADLKVSSVPGYVVELLVLKYGDFEKAIKGISKWQQREVMDIEGYYTEKQALKMFDSSLVVIDPVDKSRNVGASLSLNQYSRIIAASRAFLKKPSINFFFPKKVKPWPASKVRAMLKKKELVAVKIGWPKELPDILWGQLFRLSKKVASELDGKGFSVLRSKTWSDEKERMIIIFELANLKLQKSMKRTGPLVADDENSQRFLKAHKKVVAGPRIEKGRWVIEVERKYTDAEDLLTDCLKVLKKTEKAAVKRGLRKKALVLDEKGLMKLYGKSKEFREFFTSYLKGKEEFG